MTARQRVADAAERDRRNNVIVVNVPEPIRVPGSCLVCSGDMLPTGLVQEYPTTGRAQTWECERGCSSEHRQEGGA